MTINNRKYTRSEIFNSPESIFSDMAADSSDILNNWLERELLYLKAIDKNMDKDPDLKKMADEYYRDLLADKYLEYHLSEKIGISDEEINSFYRENRQSFRLQTNMARIVHYRFDSIDDAKASKRVLIYGDMTQKNELTERFFPEKKLISEGGLISVLNDAVFSGSRQNRVIGPLSSEYGFHVIEVIEYYPENTYLPAGELRSTIRERIGNRKKNLEYRFLMDELKEEYDIETF